MAFPSISFFTPKVRRRAAYVLDVLQLVFALLTFAYSVGAYAAHRSFAHVAVIEVRR